MSRPRLLTLAVATAACLVPWIGGGTAVAADEPERTAIELSTMPAQDERGNPVEGQYWITVMLTTEDGRYVANRPIQISEPVDFFGQHEARLGTVVTDGTGFGAVVYQPSQAGERTIVARFGGDTQYATSKAELALDAANVVAPFTSQPPPLASVGQWLAVFLGFLGVAFWAVLLSVLARTAWGIRTAPGAAARPMPAAGSGSQEVPI